MPRIVRHASSAESSSIVARSHSRPTRKADERELRSTFLVKPGLQDYDRTYFGRATDLSTIEQAIRSANDGVMRDITDLSRETINTDPHLAAVLNKRLGSVAALPWEVVPVTGYGINREKAMFFAAVVQEQLEQLDNFMASILQLAWALFDGRSALEIEWGDTTADSAARRRTPTSHVTYGSVLMEVRKLGWLHPRRLHFGSDRELRLYDTTTGGRFPSNGTRLDAHPFKFVQFLPQLFGDYSEREGLCRRCLYWSYFKRFGARERMILLELFGKPFRWLEVGEDSSASQEDLEEADEILQQIGGTASFRFPRGTTYQMQQPAQGAGAVHQQVIEESDRQLSKLVLGQTGTTDGMAGGLNTSQASVMQDEQFMILNRDARAISEAIETWLSDAIIELNFGGHELAYAPHFRLRADVPLDRTKELERLRQSLDAGLEVSLDQAYEVSGFRAPKKEDPVVRIETPPAHPLAVQPPAERAIIVYPENADVQQRQRVRPIPSVDAKVEGLPDPAAPAAPVPSDGATPSAAPGIPGDTGAPSAAIPQFDLGVGAIETILTINEARATKGLGPLTKSDGSVDPDGFLTIGEFKAKRNEAARASAASAAPSVAASDVLAAPDKYAHISFRPPRGVRLEARRGLAWRDQYKRGGTEVGVARARDLSNNRRLSPDTVRRMKAYFDRHQIDRKADGWKPGETGYPSAGRIAWALWGGDPGWAWVRKVVVQMEAADSKLKNVRGSAAFDESSDEGEESDEVTLPFSGFDDFDDCVLSLMDQGHDEESASAICGALQQDAEGVVQSTLDSVRRIYGNPHPSDVAVVLAMLLPRTPPVRLAEGAEGELLDDDEDELSDSPVESDAEIGSTEVIVEKGVSEGARASALMASEYARAVDGLEDPEEIEAALEKAHESMDLQSFARPYERRTIHGFMTGALSDAYEAATDDLTPMAKFAAPTKFVEQAYREAQRSFQALDVLPKEDFDRLSVAARRRAFTVAGVHNTQMLEVARDELSKALSSGTSLREFRKLMAERFTSAGMTPLNPSHIDTIYRTGVASAYQSGRFAHATTERMLRLRPYWQVRTVNDSRRRPTHGKAEGLILKSTHPFWKRAYPPFGFQCRCRVVTISAKTFEREGLKLGNPRGLRLPDPGFVSGTPTLLG